MGLIKKTTTATSSDELLPVRVGLVGDVSISGGRLRLGRTAVGAAPVPDGATALRWLSRTPDASAFPGRTAETAERSRITSVAGPTTGSRSGGLA
jgi:hypothetical protein